MAAISRANSPLGENLAIRVVSTQEEAIEIARTALSTSDEIEVLMSRVAAPAETPRFRVMWAIDLKSSIEREAMSQQPNVELAAALEEAKNIKPRFSSVQELFDALENQGRD